MNPKLVVPSVLGVTRILKKAWFNPADTRVYPNKSGFRVYSRTVDHATREERVCVWYLWRTNEHAKKNRKSAPTRQEMEERYLKTLSVFYKCVPCEPIGDTQIGFDVLKLE